MVPNEKTLIEDEKEVLNYMGEGIISVATLLKVFHTGGSKDEDNHRFSNLEKEGSCDKVGWLIQRRFCTLHYVLNKYLLQSLLFSKFF